MHISYFSCVFFANSLELDNLKSYRDLTDSFELEDGEYEIIVALNTKEILDKHLIVDDILEIIEE